MRPCPYENRSPVSFFQPSLINRGILTLHLHIPLHLAHVLQQITPLKVLVRMHNSLQLRGSHDTIALGLFEFFLVEVFEDAVLSLVSKP